MPKQDGADGPLPNGKPPGLRPRRPRKRRDRRRDGAGGGEATSTDEGNGDAPRHPDGAHRVPPQRGLCCGVMVDPSKIKFYPGACEDRSLGHWHDLVCACGA